MKVSIGDADDEVKHVLLLITYIKHEILKDDNKLYCLTHVWRILNHVY